MRRIATLVAIATTLLGIGSFLVSILMLSAISSGAYEPVRDDGMSAERAAFVPTRLKIIAAISLAAIAGSGLWLWRSGHPSEPRNAADPR
jgi:hypothetical protein